MTDTPAVIPRVPPSGSRLSLVALLSAILFLELWLNRIAARLVRIDPGAAGVLGRIDVPARLSFELASVLSTLLLGWALIRIVAQAGQLRALRLSFAVIGGMTCALAAGGVWLRLPVRLQVYLYVSTLSLVVIVALGALAVPVRRRNRLGIALLATPVVMMLVANLFQRFSPPGLLDPRASGLGELAGGAFVLAGLLAPLLFPPSTRRSPIASGAGAVVLCTALVLGRLDWSFVARITGIGVGVAIPFGVWTLPVYALGAASFAYTITALLASPGTDRLRGVGLLLVCLVGLQLELPYQLASSALGFMCLLESLARTVPPAMSRAALDELLRRVATHLSATQVTVVGESGREAARLGFTAGGYPGQLVVERRRSLITRVELTVGERPERAPPLSLSTRDATSLGPAAPGPIVATDDAPFDDRFVVRDHRGAGTAALATEMRGRLLAHVEGWIGVWPQRGACFRGRTLPPADDFSSLSQLLVRLVQQAGT